MIATRLSAVMILLLIAGCVDNAVPALDELDQPNSSEGQTPAPSSPATAPFTHVLTADAEYYTAGPQQARPPDGTWTAGTKVVLIREAGSYSLVRAEDGTEAYVSTDVLERIGSMEKQAMAAEPKKVVEGNDEFAFDLYARLRSEAGNLFFSPSSISTALAMTYAGARGQTEAQMAKVLHFPVPQAELHAVFAELTQTLGAADKTASYQLHVANRLWGQQGFGFLPEFLETTRKHYGAELAELDFASATETARQTINDWIERQTNEKIKDLIPQGVLDAMTRLVLTNAVYFKGDWTEPFKSDRTKNAPFHLTADEDVEVPLMHQRQRFPYAAVDGLQLLELPYGKEKHLAMLVLLPEKVDGLPALEASLSGESLARWSSQLRSREVDVYLPRFKLESQFQLADTLGSLGMTLPFSPNEADFSGMNGKRDLFLSAVIHKAYVDVNEQGTEAAAATAAAVQLTAAPAQPVVFRADHPFVFLIRDRRTSAILFLGRLMNPSD